MKTFKSLVYSGTVPNLVCCEAILRETSNGDWLVFFKSGGPIEPHPDNNVFMKRSTDKGRTWGRLRQLFSIPGTATYVTEVTVIGEKITAYVSTHEGGFLDWKEWAVESYDNGYTWGEFKPIPAFENHTFVRNLYINKKGQYILPFQHVEISEEERGMLRGEGKKIFQGANAEYNNGVFISDDKGESWAAYGGVRLPEKYLVSGAGARTFVWFENNVVELSDGTLVMLNRVCRTGLLFRADSKDGGKTWGELYPTDIPNASSKIRLFKLRDGRIALLHNPTPWKPGVWLFARNPMALWISDDDMKTWSYKKVIEDFPGALSYPDGFIDEENGLLNFVFDYNRHDVIFESFKI